MERDDSNTAAGTGHSPEEELLDEVGEEGRWTPVAFTMAVTACEMAPDPTTEPLALEAAEELKASILDSADRDNGHFDEEGRWTPVALRLARSKSSQSPS